MNRIFKWPERRGFMNIASCRQRYYNLCRGVKERNPAGHEAVILQTSSKKVTVGS